MKTSGSLLAILVVAFLLSGCATPSASRADRAVGWDSTRPELTVGMASAEVERLWGKPSKVEPVADPEATVEVWTYFGDVSTRSMPIVATMQMVPIFSLEANKIIDAPAPVYQVETRRTEEVFMVVLIDGQVAALRRATRELPRTVQ